MAARIQHLGPQEWERLRAIRIRSLRDAPDAFCTTAEAAEARTPEGWRNQLEEVPTFVAVDGGADVGMVRCAPCDGEPDAAILISMWTAPEARGKGVAGALIDAVVGWARERNFARVVLDVGDTNAGAIALYERKGFRPTGRTGTLPPPREHIREHRRSLSL